MIVLSLHIGNTRHTNSEWTDWIIFAHIENTYIHITMRKTHSNAFSYSVNGQILSGMPKNGYLMVESMHHFIIAVEHRSFHCVLYCWSAHCMWECFDFTACIRCYSIVYVCGDGREIGLTFFWWISCTERELNMNCLLPLFFFFVFFNSLVISPITFSDFSKALMFGGHVLDLVHSSGYAIFGLVALLWILFIIDSIEL